MRSLICLFIVGNFLFFTPTYSYSAVFYSYDYRALKKVISSDHLEITGGSLFFSWNSSTETFYRISIPIDLCEFRAGREKTADNAVDKLSFVVFTSYIEIAFEKPEEKQEFEKSLNQDFSSIEYTPQSLFNTNLKVGAIKKIIVYLTPVDRKNLRI